MLILINYLGTNKYTMKNKIGNLYLLPSSLGNQDTNKILPGYNIQIMNQLDEFIVENARTARRFLKSAGYTYSLDTIKFHILDKHTNISEYSSFLNSLLDGKDIGLLSEAGTPCIADPGADIVKIAHEKNIKVIPLIGPSSIILSLMASGFNGQNFAFHGYLPIENNARSKKIKELEKTLFREDQTQIFIETPYRNMKLLNSILENCSNKTNLCIASDITLDSEFIISNSIYNWKKNIPEINKKPTVFLLYK